MSHWNWSDCWKIHQVLISVSSSVFELTADLGQKCHWFLFLWLRFLFLYLFHIKSAPVLLSNILYWYSSSPIHFQHICKLFSTRRHWWRPNKQIAIGYKYCIEITSIAFSCPFSTMYIHVCVRDRYNQFLSFFGVSLIVDKMSEEAGFFHFEAFPFIFECGWKCIESLVLCCIES